MYTNDFRCACFEDNPKHISVIYFVLNEVLCLQCGCAFHQQWWTFVIEIALSMHCRRHGRHINTLLGVGKVRWRDVYKVLLQLLILPLNSKTLALTIRPQPLHPPPYKRLFWVRGIQQCGVRQHRVINHAQTHIEPTTFILHKLFKLVRWIVDSRQAKFINMHWIVSERWRCQKGAIWKAKGRHTTREHETLYKTNGCFAILMDYTYRDEGPRRSPPWSICLTDATKQEET